MVEINDDTSVTYTTNSKIITLIVKFKTSMLKSSSCDYSDAYMLVGRTVTITDAAINDVTKRADERKKEIMFKNKW